jgi:hypothetical protein
MTATDYLLTGEWTHLCGACLLPIEPGKEGKATVPTSDKENPVTVHVHEEFWCYRNAKPYPKKLDEIKEIKRAAFMLQDMP